MTREAWVWVLTAVGLLSLILGVLSEVVRRAQEHARKAPAPTPKPGEVWGVKSDGSRVLLSADYRSGSFCVPDEVVGLIVAPEKRPMAIVQGLTNEGDLL